MSVKKVKSAVQQSYIRILLTRTGGKKTVIMWNMFSFTSIYGRQGNCKTRIGRISCCIFPPGLQYANSHETAVGIRFRVVVATLVSWMTSGNAPYVNCFSLEAARATRET